MSRSYKRPYEVYYHKRCPKDYPIARKMFRAKVRGILNSGKSYEDIEPLLPQHVREVQDIWSMSQDGKQRWVGKGKRHHIWWRENAHWNKCGTKLVK